MDILSCSICANKYDEQIRQPKILDCGHTFCKKCLKDSKMSRISMLGGQMDEPIDLAQKIRCFTCRIETFKNIDALTINWALIPHFEQEKPQVKFTKQQAHCTKDKHHHQHEQADFYCKLCQNFLCSDCKSEHLQIGCSDSQIPQALIEAQPNVRRSTRKTTKARKGSTKYREQTEINEVNLVRVEEIIENLNRQIIRSTNIFEQQHETNQRNLEVLSKIERFIASQAENSQKEISNQYNMIAKFINDMKHHKKNKIKEESEEAQKYIFDHRNRMKLAQTHLQEEKNEILQCFQKITHKPLQVVLKQNLIEEKAQEANDRINVNRTRFLQESDVEQIKHSISSNFEILAQKDVNINTIKKLFNPPRRNDHQNAASIIESVFLVPDPPKTQKKRESKAQAKLQQQVQKIETRTRLRDLEEEKVPPQVEVVEEEVQIIMESPPKSKQIQIQEIEMIQPRSNTRGRKPATQPKVQPTRSFKNLKEKKKQEIIQNQLSQLPLNPETRINAIQQHNLDVPIHNEEEKEEAKQERLIDNEKDDRLNQEEEKQNAMFLEGSTQATMMPFNQHPPQQRGFMTTPRQTAKKRSYLEMSNKKFSIPHHSQQHLQEVESSQTPVNLSKRQVFPENIINNNNDDLQILDSPSFEMIPQFSQRQARKEQERNRQQAQRMQSPRTPRAGLNNRSISPMTRSQQKRNLQTPTSLNNQEESKSAFHSDDLVSEAPQNQLIQFVLQAENKVLILNPRTFEWSCVKWTKQNSTHDQNQNNYNRSFFQQNIACCMFPKNKNKMLMTGGSASAAVFTVEYLPSENRVNILRLEHDMIEARGGHQLVYCDKSFYAIGGDSGTGNLLRSCERLKVDNFKNITTCKWEQSPQMKKPRKDFGAVTSQIANVIVAFGSGGFQHRTQDNSIELFNQETYQWNLLKHTMTEIFQNISGVHISTEGNTENFIILGTPLDLCMAAGQSGNTICQTKMYDFALKHHPNKKVTAEKLIPRKTNFKLNERRIVGNNVFFSGSKLFILGGNNNFNGEFLDLEDEGRGFQMIGSYKDLSKNVLSALPSGCFQEPINLNEE